MAYTWFILLLALVGTALFLLLLHGTSLGRALHEGIPDRPRRRLFVASVSFFLTFAGVRAVVYGVVHNIPPFHFVQVGGRHSIISCSGSSFCCWWDMAGFARWEMDPTGHQFLWGG